MHIISRSKLVKFVADDPRFTDAEAPLDRWYRTTKRAGWRNFAELKTDFRTADRYRNLTIFDIKGNTYRLIAEVLYHNQTVLVREVLTHRDYDRGLWKTRWAS
ncbi:MAG: type II toxin-antitoxin system HigB family toxin [Isosphaeraceae bacterium]